MAAYKKIFIAADHAGFDLKKYLIENNSGLPWMDLGPASVESVDYPDYADKVVMALGEQKNSTDFLGVLICGSGQGMAIRANRFSHVRAALCTTVEAAQLARAHNNANVLCMGARVVAPELAIEILNTFLNTPFEGGRHERRVNKLSQSRSS